MIKLPVRYQCLLTSCYLGNGFYGNLLLTCFVVVTIVVTRAVLCSTGRKTVTVDDLLRPDAPFVQRKIKVSTNSQCTYKANP